MDPTGTHHIPDDDRFTPYKKSYQCHSRQKPDLVCALNRIHDCPQVLSMKDTIDRQPKYYDQKYRIKNYLFCFVHTQLTLL